MSGNVIRTNLIIRLLRLPQQVLVIGWHCHSLLQLQQYWHLQFIHFPPSGLHRLPSLLLLIVTTFVIPSFAIIAVVTSFLPCSSQVEYWTYCNHQQWRLFSKRFLYFMLTSFQFVSYTLDARPNHDRVISFSRLLVYQIAF